MYYLFLYLAWFSRRFVSAIWFVLTKVLPSSHGRTSTGCLSFLPSIRWRSTWSLSVLSGNRRRWERAIFDTCVRVCVHVWVDGWTSLHCLMLLAAETCSTEPHIDDMHAANYFLMYRGVQKSSSVARNHQLMWLTEPVFWSLISMSSRVRVSGATSPTSKVHWEGKKEVRKPQQHL